MSWPSDFISFGYILRSEITAPYGSSISNVLNLISILTYLVAVQVFPPTSNGGVFLMGGGILIQTTIGRVLPSKAP